VLVAIDPFCDHLRIARGFSPLTAMGHRGVGGGQPSRRALARDEDAPEVHDLGPPECREGREWRSREVTAAWR
jgi:hypothetical protein